MPRLRVGQLGFADAAVARRGRGEPTGDLAAIARLVDWAPFERLLDPVHRSAKGEAAYPPLVMFKALLLGRWHALSDPGLEAALADRLSFLRFCGLSLDDPTPDHTTLWRFREALARTGLMDALLDELARQLDAAGVTLRTGTLVDASLVTSAARRPRLDEGATSPADPDARFGTTNERGRFAFGYKAHVAVDRGSGLIVAGALTPANVADVAAVAALLPGAAGTVYADRGCDSAALRAALSARGLGDGIMRRRRGGRGAPALGGADVARNHALSLVRRAVEGVFGTLKRVYRMGRMRAFSLARNRVDLALFALAYNLRRWRALAATG